LVRGHCTFRRAIPITFLEDFDCAPQLDTRVVGIAYLASLVIGLLDEVFVRGTMIVTGDPAIMTNNIAASPSLFIGVSGLCSCRLYRRVFARAVARGQGGRYHDLDKARVTEPSINRHRALTRRK
jgi:hypothetical protein